MRWGLLLLPVVACANASDAPPISDATTNPDTPMSIIDASPGTPRTCATDQYAVTVLSNGNIVCAAPGTHGTGAIAANCSIAMGWRDDCDGCTTPPLKHGRAGIACTNTGTDTTCTTQTLGNTTALLFGLNPDGDMDGNDKLYGSLHCTPVPTSSDFGPCPPGQFITGLSGVSWTCAPLAVAAVNYVRTSCSLYLGWRDDCDGCTTAPAKWGYAGATTCMNGAGVDNTCSTATLGTETVNLFGLNPDGDVDGNDKLYIGLHCNAPSPSETTSTTTCPPDHFVTGTATDGSFVCTSPAPLFHQYFTSSCSVFYGWRDNCDGCATPPAKWGSAKVGSCANGAGGDNTCGKYSLGSMVDLFGLNPDGDVDGNDMLSVGLQCL